MQVSRRGIMIGTLVGGGLALGYLLRPRTYPIPLEAGRDEVAFDAWIKLTRDGVVTVAVPQLEMGQGVTTLIPQIVAVELGADWRQMAVEPAPVSAVYANLPLATRWRELWMPIFPSLAASPNGPVTRRWAEGNRFTATADGTSLAAYEMPARAAAASVRALLAKAAAARWGVSWEDCEARNGLIAHAGKRATFGELAQEAAGYDPPDPPPLRADPAFEKPSVDRPGVGLSFPRLDLPSKVDGSHRFAGDVRLPDMVHAAIRHGPIGDTALGSFDARKGAGTPGLVGVVKGRDWLAAVATDWWAAERALAAMEPKYVARRRADSQKMEAALQEAVAKGEATRFYETGNADGIDANPAVEVSYDVAPALHATLETASATARLVSGKLELWVATQAPEAVRRDAAAAVGIDVADVVLYPVPAGGSFDRRLESDHAVEAAVIAREIGRPVQLTWSRWQEHLRGWPRPPAAARMTASMDRTGRVTGWKARLALPSTGHEFGRRLFGGESAFNALENSAGRFDALAIEGAIPQYDIADIVIEHVPVNIGLPTARLRGNAHGYTAFCNESFIDELARKANREPLSFRMALLGKDLRLAQCLQRVATLANWGGGGDASGQGLACHVIGNGRIAAVATARRDESGVRVDRISAVADIGRIVNFDIARQQIEGGLVYGVGLALGSSTDYVDGLPVVGRLAPLDLPLLGDCPAIEVDFIDSVAEPADPGELGVAVAAPAIANALFSATGLRFRRLPLLSEDA